MPRITPADLDHANDKQKPLFDAVTKKMGQVPNVLKTLGHSPAALDAYLKLSAAQEESSFSAAERELLALAISAENQCSYCVSAHSAISSQLKLDEQTIEAAMSGKADDPKMQGALSLAKAITAKKGWVDDETLSEAKAAGLDATSIMDVVLAVAANTLTNYANHLAETDIDFPLVDLPGKQ